jgi:hypothetical protein
MLIRIQIHTYRSVKECSSSKSYVERCVYHNFTPTGMQRYSGVYEVVTVASHCFLFRVWNGINACVLRRNQG